MQRNIAQHGTVSCSTAEGAVRACDAQARALCLALQGDALVVYEKSESVIGAVIELNAKEIRPKIPVTVRPPARPPPRAVRSAHARIHPKSGLRLCSVAAADRTARAAQV